MTTYENFRKQMRNIGAYVALVAALTAASVGSLVGIVEAAERKGEPVCVASTYNPNNPVDYDGDKQPDQVDAFAFPAGSKDGKTLCEVKVSYLFSPKKPVTIDTLELPDGICLRLTDSDKNKDGIWDVAAVAYKCGDFSTRKTVARYINDGRGNFTKE